MVWCLFNRFTVYDVLVDVINTLIAWQDEVDADTAITSYKCKAMRYKGSTGKVDTYYGTNAVTIAPLYTDVTFIFPTNNKWLMSDTVITPDE